MKFDAVHDFIMRSKAEKERFIAEWQKINKYYQGFQWPENTPAWKPTPISNFVYATVEQRHANLIANRFAPSLFPREPGDEEAVRAYQMVVDSKWDELSLDKLVNTAIKHALLYGTYIAKVYWDNSLEGGSLKPVTLPDGSQVPGTLWKGDIRVEGVSCYSFFPQPGVNRIEDMRKCAIAVRVPLEWIKANKVFNQSAVAKVKPDTDFAGVNQSYTTAENNLVTFVEFWVRNADDTVDVFYYADEQLLYKIEAVTTGELPFAVLYDHEIDNCFWGFGEPRQIIPNQEAMNKLTQLVIQNAMLIVNKPILLSIASGADPKVVAQNIGKPGAVFPVNDVSAIEFGKTEELPISVFKTIEMLKEDIRETMGMHQAYIGQTPGSVTAASGILALQERAAARDNLKGLYIEDFIIRMTKLMVKLIQQNYTTTRYIRIMGEDGTVGFKPFNAQEYGDVSIDVRISGSANTVISRAVAEQQAKELLSLQYQYNVEPALITPEEFIQITNIPLKQNILKRMSEERQALSEHYSQEALDKTPVLGNMEVEPPAPIDAGIDETGAF